MELTLYSLLPDILGRLEENVEGGPIFWGLTGEVYPGMVDGLFEASLISGVVQLNSQQVTLAANTTYFALQGCATGMKQPGYGEGGYGVTTVLPVGIVAPLRLRAPYPIRKTSLAALDAMNPKWQQAAAEANVKAWFPLGVSGFGIYPQLSTDQTVILDCLYSPVNVARPYTGNESIPLQQEFTDLLPKYAAAQLRCKEGGAETEEADVVYQEYLAELKELSLFQQKIDSLVFSSAFGGKSGVNPRTAV